MHVSHLQDWNDDLGNLIAYRGNPVEGVKVIFKGSGNRLVVDGKARISHLRLTFSGDGGLVEIGPSENDPPRSPLRLDMRVGHRSRVTIGRGVSCGGALFVSAVEGTSVTVGDDCMFATDNQLRVDDTHPIYDVRSGERVNKARDIVVGDHVWLAKHAVVMGGVTIGSGSTVGFRSVVTRSIPNNVVAVGAPARVVRRDTVWERPPTYPRVPGVDVAPQEERSVAYWTPTADDDAAT